MASFLCIELELRLCFTKAMGNYNDESKDKGGVQIGWAFFTFFFLRHFDLCYCVWLQWIKQVIKGSYILCLLAL